MNELFKKTKSKSFQLDNEFRLTPDGFKGLVLQREIEKEGKDKEGNSKIIIQTESFYFPKISQTLKKYLELKSCDAKSIEELKEIVLKVEKTIESIKEVW